MIVLKDACARVEAGIWRTACAHLLAQRPGKLCRTHTLAINKAHEHICSTLSSFLFLNVNLPLKPGRVNELAKTTVQARKTHTTVDVFTIDARVATRTQALHRRRVENLTNATVLALVLTRIDSHFAPVASVAERAHTNKIAELHEADSIVLTGPIRAEVNCLLTSNTREAVSTQAAESIEREGVDARVYACSLVETRRVATKVDLGLAEGAGEAWRALATVAARAQIVYTCCGVEARPGQASVNDYIAEFARVARHALAIVAAHDVHACGIVGAEHGQTGSAFVHVRLAVDASEARGTLTLVLINGVEQVDAEASLARIRFAWIAVRLAPLPSIVLN